MKKAMGIAAVLAASTAFGGGATAQSLTTTFANNNGASGNAFDLIVGPSGITITGLDVNTSYTSATTLEVWYRSGTYDGNLNSSVGWTQIDSGSVVGAGSGNPTTWDIADQFLSANTTYGFRVVSPNGGINYTNGATTTSDANLTIQTGVGLSYNSGNVGGFGGAVFSPRTWNGTVYYVLGNTVLAAPGAQDTITAAAGTTGRLIVVGADGIARDAGLVSLATRDDQLTLTRVADSTATGSGIGTVTASTSNMPGMIENIYAWAEVTGFYTGDYGSGDGSARGAGLQIGGDIEVGPDMVAGVSLGYSDIDVSDTGTTTEGSYAYLQPYFAMRSGVWHGTASLIYGQGDLDESSGAGDGSAEVTLAALTLEGGYDHALRSDLTLTPTVGLIYGREDVSGTSGTLAGTSSDVTFGQLSLGSRITYTTADGTVFAGLHADYLDNQTDSAVAQDLLAESGWTGRIEFGGEMDLANGMGLSTSVELSGLGGDMQTVSGGLRVEFQF